MRLAVHHFDTVESTQSLAKAECIAGRLSGPAVFIAATQTGGVGRFGRAWASPRGGLWCTIAAPFERPVTGATGVCIGAGLVGLLREELRTDAVSLKWPNDAVIDGRKVGGVLVESIASGSQRWLMIGVGLNADFPLGALPESLRESATTLAAHGMHLDLESLRMGLVMVLLGSAHPGPLSDEQQRQISERLWGVGQRGRWTGPDGSRVEGVFRGIDAHGRAEIETPKGMMALHSVEPS